MPQSAAVPLPPRIAREEFLVRQERARELAAARGWSGILAWGRGASTQDRYADLYYLSNYYTQYPFTPDEPERWRARGHGALVLPVSGSTRLIVDMPAFRDDLAVADDVIFSEDVVGTTAHALRSAVPNGMIGVMGNEALAWRWHECLRDYLGPRLIDADDVGPALRVLKSDAELELMRAAGALGTRAVDAIMDAAVPGASEAEVAAAGVTTIVNGGGAFYGMGISCGPYAHSYGQSQPAPYDGRYRLREGDMARVDLYGSVDGYLFDFGRTCVVGGSPSDEQQAMIAAVRDSVLAGVGAIAAGVSLGDVARRCDQVLAASEFLRKRPSLLSGFGTWGHSLGLTWEAPWIDAKSRERAQPRMCLSIEKRLAVEGLGGATYEDNFIVTEDGCELTTHAKSLCSPEPDSG